MEFTENEKKIVLILRKSLTADDIHIKKAGDDQYLVRRERKLPLEKIYLDKPLTQDE